MTTDKIRDTLLEQVDRWGWPLLVAAAVLALVVLLVLAHVLRRLGRGDAAKRVTALATVLGLGWSAQGMWDTAVNRYHQPGAIASVLFVVFEAWLVGRMLRAHEYRTDYARRGKFVVAVWTGALIMAFVVASGEGWAQAPGRLAIPLLVTYGWYTDLTADDAPGDRPRTSFRWTPRRAALAIGMIEPGARDAETIDRDRLRNRMTRLAFRIDRGDAKISELLRREVRLAKLKTFADDDDVAAVRARLARMSVDLMATPEPPAPAPEPEPIQQPAPEVHPVMPPQPKPPERVQPGRPQGEHEIEGRKLRGPELRADGVARMLASVRPGRPQGMPTIELMDLYDPPLKQRTADTIAAEARKQINAPINGNVPSLH